MIISTIDNTVRNQFLKLKISTIFHLFIKILSILPAIWYVTMIKILSWLHCYHGNKYINISPWQWSCVSFKSTDHWVAVFNCTYRIVQSFWGTKLSWLGHRVSIYGKLLRLHQNNVHKCQKLWNSWENIHSSSKNHKICEGFGPWTFCTIRYQAPLQKQTYAYQPNSNKEIWVHQLLPDASLCFPGHESLAYGRFNVWYVYIYICWYLACDAIDKILWAYFKLPSIGYM